MMLSRIADSFFWIARYMERAEDTARILNVNYHMLLDQSPKSYRLRWDQLVTAGRHEIWEEINGLYHLVNRAAPWNARI